MNDEAGIYRFKILDGEPIYGRFIFRQREASPLKTISGLLSKIKIR